MPTTPLYKLGAFHEGKGWIEHRHAHVYTRRGEEIIAAPADGAIDLVQAALPILREPLSVIYSLHIPLEPKFNEGTYTMREPCDESSARAFLARFADLLQLDGRQDLTVQSARGSVTLDQHNQITFVGDLPAFELLLTEHGLAEGKIELPSPHSHHEHEAFDPVVAQLLSNGNWDWSPPER